MPRALLTPISNNRRSRIKFSPYLRGQIIAKHNNGLKKVDIARQLNLSSKAVKYTVNKDP